MFCPFLLVDNTNIVSDGGSRLLQIVQAWNGLITVVVGWI